MATLPAFLRKNEAAPAPAAAAETVTRAVRRRVERDPYRLRALPHDDIFFYCKRIDNSRLVREADPQSRGACWNAIGAACVLLAVLTTAFAPTAMTRLAGYKLEALHGEQQRLLEEARAGSAGSGAIEPRAAGSACASEQSRHTGAQPGNPFG